jgi:hypothetical protein
MPLAQIDSSKTAGSNTALHFTIPPSCQRVTDRYSQKQAVNLPETEVTLQAMFCFSRVKNVLGKDFSLFKKHLEFWHAFQLVS